MKTCPICGKPQPGYVLCDQCRLLPEQQQYDVIVRRFDESINQAKVLLNEAYKSGDQETVWVARKAVEQLEKQKQSLRKPR